MDFGSRLRKFREKAGLSIAQLARRAGMDKQRVGQIESKPGYPRGDAVANLAAALGMTSDALLPPVVPTSVTDPAKGRPRKPPPKKGKS